jgi:hypothetical protein
VPARSETATRKADEMLAQLASWGRALRTVREERVAVA